MSYTVHDPLSAPSAVPYDSLHVAVKRAAMLVRFYRQTDRKEIASCVRVTDAAGKIAWKPGEAPWRRNQW